MPARHPGAEADGSGAGGCDVVSVGADVLGGILKRWANWFCCDQDANDTALKESKIVLGEPLSDIIGQVKNFENNPLNFCRITLSFMKYWPYLTQSLERTLKNC